MFLPELSSFVASLLFAVHPIHTEAVSIIYDLDLWHIHGFPADQFFGTLCGQFLESYVDNFWNLMWTVLESYVDSFGNFL